jgi:hypothetical protein
MNILTLNKRKNERVPAKKEEIYIVDNILFRKPLFDRDGYYYFTEVWKYRLKS